MCSDSAGASAVASDGHDAECGIQTKIPSIRRQTSLCPICHQAFLKKNMKKHMQRRHDNQQKQLPAIASILVDPRRGVFLCMKKECGNNYPIHVQLKVSCGVKEIFCENQPCQEATKVSGRCSFAAYQCPHLQSAAYAQIIPQPPPLEVSVLENLVTEKIIKQKAVDSIVSYAKQSLESEIPPVVWWQPSPASEYAYMSVYATEATSYCPLQRVVVRFNMKSAEYDCACCAKRRGCLHKKLALWYTAQFHSELLHNQPVVSEDAPVTDAVTYQYAESTTESHIPVNVKGTPVARSLTVIEPPQTHCPKCQTGLQRWLVTNSRKVFDMDNIITSTG